MASYYTYPKEGIKKAMSHTAAVLSLALISALPLPASAQRLRCNDCYPRVAVKTNLLHDVALTPDLGIEVSIARRFSVSLEGVYAWWSNDAKHRYWRIRGGSFELRTWFGGKREERALSGHHIGVYGSMYDYDFEFGRKGWQSPDFTYGAGIGYGYAIPINSRLNLDFGLKVGYSAGNLIKYKPQCGTYVCTERSFHRHIGLTGLEVTLVWFPGRDKKNNPNFGMHDL